MSSKKSFEKYLESLDEEQYTVFMQQRIARLNPEQQGIAQAREGKRKDRAKLVAKLKDPNPDVHEMVFDALRDMDGDECEHGRNYVKHCLACGEMDHLMFPELFDEDGFDIQDDE